MTILIADDDAVSIRRLEHFLTVRGHDVIIARDGITARNELRREDAPKLAILDWQMPGMDGIEICRDIRTSEPSRFVYLMLLTGKTSRQDIAAGIEAGADDYLRKPLDEQELTVRLRAATRIVAFYEATITQAAHDALTDVWNRRAIYEVLRKELARAVRARTRVAVIMADVDHFKNINDSCGHHGGDRVLREVATRLKTSLRPSDAVGRYGGEEFMIVLPDCDLENAVAAAERLRHAIADEPIATADGCFPVTLSLGVASYYADDLEEDEFVRAADEALYRAKREGRNRVECAHSPVLIPESALLVSRM